MDSAPGLHHARPYDWVHRSLVDIDLDPEGLRDHTSSPPAPPVGELNEDDHVLFDVPLDPDVMAAALHAAIHSSLDSFGIPRPPIPEVLKIPDKLKTTRHLQDLTPAEIRQEWDKCAARAHTLRPKLHTHAQTHQTYTSAKPILYLGAACDAGYSRLYDACLFAPMKIQKQMLQTVQKELDAMAPHDRQTFLDTNGRAIEDALRKKIQARVMQHVSITIDAIEANKRLAYLEAPKIAGTSLIIRIIEMKQFDMVLLLFSKLPMQQRHDALIKYHVALIMPAIAEKQLDMVLWLFSSLLGAHGHLWFMRYYLLLKGAVRQNFEDFKKLEAYMDVQKEALRKACLGGHLEDVKRMLLHLPLSEYRDYLKRCDDNGNSLLHEIAKLGFDYMPIAERLMPLSDGLWWSQRNKADKTPYDEMYAHQRRRESETRRQATPTTIGSPLTFSQTGTPVSGPLDLQSLPMLPLIDAAYLGI